MWFSGKFSRNYDTSLDNLKWSLYVSISWRLGPRGSTRSWVVPKNLLVRSWFTLTALGSSKDHLYESKETRKKSEDALERFGDVVVNVWCFVLSFFGWFSGTLVVWFFGLLVPCLFYCLLFLSCWWLFGVLAAVVVVAVVVVVVVVAIHPWHMAIPEARFAQREVGQFGAEDDRSFGHKKQPVLGVWTDGWHGAPQTGWYPNHQGTYQTLLKCGAVLVGNLKCEFGFLDSSDTICFWHKVQGCWIGGPSFALFGSTHKLYIIRTYHKVLL